MYEILSLGRLTLRDAVSHREIRSVTAQPKRMALLLRLALARASEPHPRQTLLALFWPELDEERARRALNQSVYFLRRSLGTGAVLTEADGSVGLGDSIYVDAHAFQADVEDGRFESALALYRGELADGFHPSAGAEFDRWLEVERRRLRGLAIDAALGWARELAQAGRPQEAVAVLRRAREWQPLEERMTGALVTCLLAAEEGAIAASEVEWFEARVASEFEQPVAESPALRAMLAAAPEGGGAGTRRGEVAQEAAPTAGAVEGPASGAGDPAARRPERPLPPPGRSRPAVVTLAFAILTLVGLVLIGDRRGVGESGGVGDIPHPSGYPTLNDGRPLLLAMPFRDETGFSDLAVLGRMAMDWIIHGASEAALTEVVPFETALSLGNGSADSSLVAAAEAAGADLVVGGSVYLRGDSVVLRARITDVGTRTMVGSVEVAAPADRPDLGVGLLQERVMGRIAVHLNPVARVAVGVARLPPRFDAYEVFSEALDAYREPRDRRWPGVAERFEQAAAMDTTFVAARLWAAQAWINAGRTEVADSVVRYLESRRGSLTSWERALLDFHRAAGSGTLNDFYLATRRLTEISGDDVWRARLALAAFFAGRLEETVRVMRTIDPARTHSLTPIARLEANALHLLGRYAEQQQVLERDGRPADWGGRFSATVGLGRVEEALASLDAVAEERTPHERAGLWLQAARELRAHGYDSLAAVVSLRAVAALDDIPPDRLSDEFRVQVLFDAGRWTEVVTVGEPALKEEADFRIMGLLGAAYARLGRTAEALEMAERLRALPNRSGEQILHEAGIHAHLEDISTALATLERAFGLGLSHHYGLHVWSLLAPLRGDPGFHALTRPRG